MLRTAPSHRSYRLVVSGLALALLSATPLQAQLPLRAEVPGAGPEECPAWDTPPPSTSVDSTYARELDSSATEALIRGDLGRAADLLRRARERDPSSGELSYRLGRVLEARGAVEGAREAFCRVLAVELETGRARESRARLEALAAAERAAIPAEARSAFARGVRAARSGRHWAAVEHFRLAASDAPEWPVARYNLGVELARVGRASEALASLRDYLQMAPEADDTVEVEQHVYELERALEGRSRSGAALALGLLLPGMGHFHQGRNWSGALVLSLSAGALATGLLWEEVTVRCAGELDGPTCPPSHVLSRESGRPLLRPSVVAAAAVTVAGAIEVFLRSGSSAPALFVAQERGAAADLDRGPRLTGPSVASRGPLVDVTLVGMTFE